MRSGIIGAEDPYIIPERYIVPSQGYQNPSGRTLLNPQGLIGGDVSRLYVFAGQSTMACSNPTARVPVSSRVDNFNIYDGAIYTYRDPPLGTSYGGDITGPGCTAGRIADKLITAGPATRVICATMAVGGTSIDQWVNDTAVARRVPVMGARLAAAGLLSSVTAIIWQQGETDNALNTPQATYTARMASLIAAWRAAGFTCKILIAQTSWNAGASHAATRAAQAAAVNNGAGIYAGPDTDTLTGANRQADNTHFSDVGADALASLWVAAMTTAGVA